MILEKARSSFIRLMITSEALPFEAKSCQTKANKFSVSLLSIMAEQNSELLIFIIVGC